MGQKIHPTGLRLGIIKTWSSRWFSGKDYASFVQEDEKIRKFINKTLAGAGIAQVDIERKASVINVVIYTAKPGMIVGRGGANIKTLKEQLTKVAGGKEVQLDINEVSSIDTSAKLVANSIAEQLEKRINFRRAMKQSMTRAMESGAQGIKVQVGGRLNGAEIARTEWAREGRIPLQTLRADVEYATSEANTVFGKIGVKVWIFKGEVMPKAKEEAAGEVA